MFIKQRRRAAFIQNIANNNIEENQFLKINKINLSQYRGNTSIESKKRKKLSYDYSTKMAKQKDSKGSLNFFKKATNNQIKERPQTSVLNPFKVSISEYKENTKDYNIVSRKRKFGILKTLPDQTDNNLIYKASTLFEKIAKAKKSLVTLETEIESTCKFNPELKTKYITSLKNVEQHKIKNLEQRYNNCKTLLDRKQIVFDEAKRANQKKINDFNDIINFRNTLLKNKAIIDNTVQVRKNKPKSVYF